MISGGESERVPVIPANAVDPTGAGDAFRGGLIKGLTQGAGIKRAVQMGTVCGYYVVQVEGHPRPTATRWPSTRPSCGNALASEERMLSPQNLMF